MMTFEETKAYWEARAASDDSMQSTTQDVCLRELELKTLSERIGKYSPQNVADVGCGDGRTTIGLAETFGNIHFTGVDYATAMVANARRVLSSRPVANVALKQGCFAVDEEVNISSTYYLVSRIVYAKICAQSGTKPDYFDEHHRYAVGLPFCGEYGPVRLIGFIKK